MGHDDLQFDPEQPEFRSAPFADLDVAGDGWSLDGLLSVYDAEADLGSHTESFARGAYRKVLASGDNVPMLYHHNDTLPVLATTKGGTLMLKDDAKGLRVKATLAQHYMGEAVRELVKRGDITGMSPGFIAGRGNSKIETRNGRTHRTITGLKRLLDVSPTWEPAYASTTAEIRSLTRTPRLDAFAMLTDALGDDEKAQALIEAITAIFAVDLETNLSQSTDGGAHPQPEVEATRQDSTDVDADVVQDGGAPASADPEEQQPSGVDSDFEVEAAARTRRLQMLGLQLPR